VGGGEDSGGPKAPLKPLTALFSYLLRLILNIRGPSQQIMKEIDDTDPTESESELSLQEEIALLRLFIEDDLDNWMKEVQSKFLKIELRVANLETQRTPEMENDDPEWFS